MDRLSDLLRLRVLVANRAAPDRVLGAIGDVVRDVEGADGPFLETIRDSLMACREHVLAGRFEDGLREIQLIHNLPVSAAEVDAWDESHFFQVELLSYMEDERDVKRIRRVVGLVGRGLELA